MINILITAIGGGGHGDQILKALTLAKNRNYRLFGADASSNCPQARLVSRFVRLPLASDKDYIHRLIDTCKEFRIDVLFHGCEQELRMFAKYRQEIEREGIFLPINTTSLIKQCMDKEASSMMLQAIGHEIPSFRVLKTIEEIDEVDFYPVVVKPKVGGGGSSNVFIAQNSDQLRGLSLYLGLERVNESFLIQEYIGTIDEEYTVGILHGLDSEFISGIALRRHLSGGLSIRDSTVNITTKHELGSRLVISSGISQGRIGGYPDIVNQCKRVANAIGSRGPLNFQCRVVDGQIRIFEINPRFSGTTSLRAMVGLNEPDLMIRKHLLGESIPTRSILKERTILRTLIETEVET